LLFFSSKNIFSHEIISTDLNKTLFNQKIMLCTANILVAILSPISHVPMPDVLQSYYFKKMSRLRLNVVE